MPRYVYAAATTQTATSDGLNVFLTLDDVWDAADPLVKHRPELFTDEPTNPRRTAPEVEQTTAAPGERRNVRRA